jgi:dethiobiotin synthetase
VILAVTGTGTGVGKTTLCAALAQGLRAQLRVGAWKPIETGGVEDGRLLAGAAGGDAGPTIALRAPLAPSVAAHMEGRSIDLDGLMREGHARARQVDLLLVELPGGMYSPLVSMFPPAATLARWVTNADWLAALAPDLVLLVAPNRLGVLHDVEVCRRAADRDGVAIDLVVLTGGGPDDLSCATNARELASRGAVVEMSTPTETRPLIDWVLSARQSQRVRRPR